MEKLLTELKALGPFKGVGFEPGATFCWSPKTKTISYISQNVDSTIALWSLLHEAGHAALEHSDYSSDLGLLLLEAEAWEQAKQLGRDFKIIIDEDHIQDCLDTYRDWLHQRSACPRCCMASMQESARKYRCHNCNCTWVVSVSRFCRPYRLTKMATETQKPTLVPSFN